MTLSDIIVEVNGIKQYDLSNTIQFLEYRGKHLFGDHFHIATIDYEVIYQILSWIVDDAKVCERYGLSTSKGILLAGPVGCGKTSIMKLINTLVPSRSAFKVVAARDITMEFSKQGYDTIYKYCRTSRSSGSICLDDIGVEPAVRYFGDRVNVIGEILLSRYDLFVSKSILTHATTNLNAHDIEQRYGPRVRSRLREMFNLISYDPASPDKRI